ncbi:BirA family biotin operon repressor/biotin-[acetyl-CoA-carboxylase] ligase [Chitinivorax tropicus]|uniref:Bifunctional ligase/repressor BirA n=1 Tax=Chitinivorax tropicus TaxID=714531 RepID=A0A840MNF7_9PROT|nr:biotin--[acetyl-CoA-carboxylase] ligase [Chitinivorax tropicus]MBB5018282.1 BirA family biotin operon repressor/biotin-[acetyl-CoA-carboxylase] ligase [Chitinivorax tropicus]
MNAHSFNVLRLLSDGQFHSGEALARQLDLSRASIWQALQGVEAAGITLYSVRGRGYRLPNPIDWLDTTAIQGGLADLSQPYHLHVQDQISSTNTVLMQQAAVGAPHRTVLAAEQQTAGRGRLGRAWVSELGGSLAFSVLWRFQQGIAHLSGLSLAVGLALIKALRELGVTEAGLKWPNDVLLNDRKLAGILIEVQGDSLGPSCAVIGIGLNCKLSADTQAHIDQAVTDVASALASPVSRNHILAGILHTLDEVMQIFEQRGFAALQAAWQTAHLFHQQQVELLSPAGVRRTVVVRGVDADGALIVEDAAGIERIHAGELSLRQRR